MPDFLYTLIVFATSVAGIAAIAHLIGQRYGTDGRRLTYALALLAGLLFWFEVWGHGSIGGALNKDDAYTSCTVPNVPKEDPATERFGVGDRIVVAQGLTGGGVSVERTTRGMTIRRDDQKITTDSRAGTASGTGAFATCSYDQEDGQ